MIDYLFIYLISGSLVNVYTMIDSDVRELWFEFGFSGFILQFIISAILFPVVIYHMVCNHFNE